jgi:hypothetical protein
MKAIVGPTACMIALVLLQGGGVASAASRSCGTVLVQGSLTYELTVTKGSPSCPTVRRIAKRYGHPISKKPRFYCGKEAYECEYSTYPAGWRCGGLFQGHFQCWHGANSPARADAAFEGGESTAARLDRRAFDRAGRRPPCTRRALTTGLHRSGLRGYIDGDTFGCAGRFAYAGVIVDRNEVTVLFRATGRHWRAASRAHYCADGSVPRQIYRPACESN